MLKILNKTYFFSKYSYPLNSFCTKFNCSRNDSLFAKMAYAHYSFLNKPEANIIKMKDFYANFFKTLNERELNQEKIVMLMTEIERIKDSKSKKNFRTGLTETQNLDQLIQLLNSFKTTDKRNKIHLYRPVTKFIENELKCLDMSVLDQGIKDKIFKFLSILFSQKLHSKSIYQDFVIKIKVSDIFPNFKPDRYVVIILYALEYENELLNSVQIKSCIEYLLANHQQFHQKNNYNDFITFTETLTLFDYSSFPSLDNWAKLLEGDIKAKLYSHEQILLIFVYSCRANWFQSTPTMEFFETQLLSSNIDKIFPNTLQKVISHFNQVNKKSRKAGMYLLNLIEKNIDLVDNKILTSFLKNYQAGTNIENLDLKINLAVAKIHKNLEVSTIAAYLYNFSLSKMLDLKFIPTLEIQILRALDQHPLKSRDIHYIFAAYSELNIYNSNLLEKLIPSLCKYIEDDSEISNQVTLIWDLAKSNYMPAMVFLHKLFREIAPKIIIQCKNEDILSTLCLGLAQILIKYHTMNKNNFNSMIYSELLASFRSIPEIIFNQQSLYKNFDYIDIASQIRFIHFFLVIKYEFPGIFVQNEKINLLLKEFENKKFEFEGTSSNLMVDVTETLKSCKINFETEKRIFGYLVDIFIAPNIIVEIDGLKHFQRNDKIRRSSDLFKDYILKNLGYKVIRVPYFEFKENFFADQTQRANYLMNKIYNEAN